MILATSVQASHARIYANSGVVSNPLTPVSTIACGDLLYQGDFLLCETQADIDCGAVVKRRVASRVHVMPPCLA